MNVSRSNLDIIITESITDDGLNLIVTVNGSRNFVMTGTMTLTMEQNSQGMIMESKLRYKRAGQELRPHMHSSFSTIFSCFHVLCSLMFLSERMVSSFSFRSTVVGLLRPRLQSEVSCLFSGLQ